MIHSYANEFLALYHRILAKLAAKISELNASAKQKIMALDLSEIMKESWIMLTHQEERLKVLICQDSIDVEFILSLIVKISRMRYQKEYDKFCKMVTEKAKAEQNVQIFCAEDCSMNEDRGGLSPENMKNLLQFGVRVSGNSKGEKNQSNRNKSMPAKGRIAAGEYFYEFKKKLAAYDSYNPKYSNTESFNEADYQVAANTTKNEFYEESPSPHTPYKDYKDVQTESDSIDYSNTLPDERTLTTESPNHATEISSAGIRNRRLGDANSSDSRTVNVDLHFIIQGLKVKRNELPQLEALKKSAIVTGLSNLLQPAISKTASPTKFAKPNINMEKPVIPSLNNGFNFAEVLSMIPQVKISSSDLWKPYDLMTLEWRPVPVASRPEYKRALLEKVRHDLLFFNSEIKRIRDKYYQNYTESSKTKALVTEGSEPSQLKRNDKIPIINTRISLNKERLSISLRPKNISPSIRSPSPNVINFYKQPALHRPSLRLNQELNLGSNEKAKISGTPLDASTPIKRQNANIQFRIMYESMLEDRFSKGAKAKFANSVVPPLYREANDSFNNFDGSQLDGYSSRSSFVLREQRERKIQMRYMRTQETQLSKDSIEDGYQIDSDGRGIDTSLCRDSQNMAMTLGRSLEIAERTKTFLTGQQKIEHSNVLPHSKLNNISHETPTAISKSLPQPHSLNIAKIVRKVRNPDPNEILTLDENERDQYSALSVDKCSDYRKTEFLDKQAADDDEPKEGDQKSYKTKGYTERQGFVGVMKPQLISKKRQNNLIAKMKEASNRSTTN